MRPVDYSIYVMAFFYGLIGSFAEEGVSWHASVGVRGGTPAKYHKRAFLIGRVCLAVVGGIVASSFASQRYDYYVYVYIGFSLPSILTKFSNNPALPDAN